MIYRYSPPLGGLLTDLCLEASSERLGFVASAHSLSIFLHIMLSPQRDLTRDPTHQFDGGSTYKT